MEPDAPGITRALLQRHGRTFAEGLSIPIERNTPSPLFRLLCASLLFSARIQASIAAQAVRALRKQGWTTAKKMAASTWDVRARVLNEAGYARYDGITSTMLGSTTALLLESYKGDLRRLREAAMRRPERERQLLKEFKGIGDVGADIFFREVQVVWRELFPFVDARAQTAAVKLGLPQDPGALLDLAGEKDFPRLVAGLVRVDLGHGYDAILRDAHRFVEQG
jgi:endonuclease III